MTTSRKRTRGSSGEDAGSKKYLGPTPCIVSSNSAIPEKPKMMSFLKKHDVKRADAVSDEVHLVCVGNGELKRTSKLAVGVALGKHIVTDKWVTNSVRAGHLVEPADYLPDDAAHEREWQFSLHEAVERGRQGVRVFEGCSVHLTPALTKDGATTKELESMLQAAGAKKVTRGLPKKSRPGLESATDSASPPSASTLVVGIEKDPDAPASSKLGWPVYSRDIISLSMLRGKVELDKDEFRITTSETGD